MKRVSLIAFAAAILLCCAQTGAQDDEQRDRTDRNIGRIERALEELGKGRSAEEIRTRKSLSESLGNLKELKKQLSELNAEAAKLQRKIDKSNEEAESLLRQTDSRTLVEAKNAIDNMEYEKAAALLNEVLGSNPMNSEAQDMLEGLLPLVCPSIYLNRWPDNKRLIMGDMPGTASAIASALRWLRVHQDKESGQWDQDGFQKNCEADKPPACDGPGVSQYDVAVTGLALLAFLGDGHTHRTGTFKTTVKRGLDWLVSQQQGDGSFGSRTAESWVYNHAIATTAVCEAYAITRDPALKEPARRAVDFIRQAQNPGLGWKYNAQDGRSDTSVTGWMVMALCAARNAGLEVEQSILDGAINWFNRATNTAGKCGYMRPGDDGSVIRGVNEQFAKLPTMTAVAIASRIFCGQSRSEEKILKGIDILMANLPDWNRPRNDRVDTYYWYCGTCAVFQYGGENWNKWSVAVKKALLENQRAGGCADGSWDPVGKWDMVGGRVSSTALNCLTLEAHYRYARTGPDESKEKKSSGSTKDGKYDPDAARENAASTALAAAKAFDLANPYEDKEIVAAKYKQVAEEYPGTKAAREAARKYEEVMNRGQ
jgi:hypothetical protein